MKSLRNSFLIVIILLDFLHSAAQNEIVWKEKIVIDGTSKYVRLCKVTKGDALGDIIMTYFKSDHSAPFGMRRSKDEGRTWSDETIFMRNDDQYYYVNPSILQLDDGRLMLSYCKRSKSPPGLVSEQGPCVKYSTDGGYTWGTETFICWGGDYEPTTIQVPNDKNGDGNNDIYLFWSMALIDQSYDLTVTQVDDVKRGFACGVVASYDNGANWENFMPTKLGARIVHRNFEYSNNSDFYMSKGNMPTPVLLPNHRIGVVCEAVDKANSPWFTVSDENDWDWKNFQGQQWSDYTYFGYPPYNSPYDNNVYPTDRTKCYRPTFQDGTFGGAPYTCVLPNGKIAFSQNSGHIIKVFVCDANGKNPVQQADPFENTRSFYSCIIPLNDHEVIVAAHEPDNLSATYIRVGEIVKDVQAPSTPQNISVTKQNSRFQIKWDQSTDDVVVYKYKIYANGNLVGETLWDNQVELSGLDSNENYSFTVKAMDYQGNLSDFSTHVRSDLNEEAITIFPNPAGEWLTVKVPWEDVTITVFNSAGQIKLHEDHFSSGRIDLSRFENGMYFFQLENKNETIYRKFLKM